MKSQWLNSCWFLLEQYNKLVSIAHFIPLHSDFPELWPTKSALNFLNWIKISRDMNQIADEKQFYQGLKNNVTCDAKYYCANKFSIHRHVIQWYYAYIDRGNNHSMFAKYMYKQLPQLNAWQRTSRTWI